MRKDKKTSKQLSKHQTCMVQRVEDIIPQQQWQSERRTHCTRIWNIRWRFALRHSRVLQAQEHLSGRQFYSDAQLFRQLF
ncbi:hypothetical protein AVEN_183184-1 [Araneus ventricosus]|uniref:Uncharacterized protein n=1 Tax=Araneus ventricosus TaxID=182803 RepID=A0A4Y2AZK9_ARAVE|nr:hypothetical protein AVEN_183184-1 [Araneus ventricosus]